jgi:single-stranded-DNA-specific exonuclease
MLAANIAELRTRLDQFARTKLTLADFEPVLDLDAELFLNEVTPELFQALQLLEPYGMGNPEPVFAARGVQLAAPARVLKDKHLKFKLRAGSMNSEELSPAAILATPRCHPDSATIRRSEREAVVGALANGNRDSRTDFRSKITFDALAWHMAERMHKDQLLAGDAIDIAFTIGNNDHPEYGGLELSLRDFKSRVTVARSTTNGSARLAEPSPH